MIKTNEIKIGSELVIVFNSALSLYDDFETEPTNPWLKKWYEPYCYFQRDRLKFLIKNTLVTYFLHENKLNRPFKNQVKELYFGAMNKQDLDAKMKSKRMQKYYGIRYDKDLRKNIEALQQVTKYCKENNIRLRFIWVSANPEVRPIPASKKVYNYLKNYAKNNSIELYDLSGKFDKECYYDQNHFNYEYGSHVFTEVIDNWLSSPKK